MAARNWKENHMVAGMVILMIASLFEKIVGVLLKVPLYNLIGSAGMGYFNSAYSIFSTFYLISLTGFPVAVSMMVSESMTRGRLKEVNRISWISLTLFAFIGLVFSSFMFLGSGFISRLIASENNSEICVKAIAPILFIICISSAFKGYYQGRKNMVPTAVSEFLDSFGKCVCGIVFAYYAVSKGYDTEICAAFAIAGVTAGHLLGCIFLILYRTFSPKPQSDMVSSECRKNTELIRSLFLLALPITVSSIALGLTSNIDAFTVINALNSPEGIALYGDYSTLATTLFRLPQAFIAPVSTALTPTLVHAVTDGDGERAKKSIDSSIRIASAVSFPAAIGLCVLSYPIIYLIFGNSNTLEAVKNTAPLLSVLSIGVIFIAIVTVTSSVLQIYGYKRLPVYATFSGALLKLVLNLVLIPIIGIVGAPLSSLLGYALMTLLNILFLKKKVYPSFSFAKACGRVFLSAVLMGAFAYGSYRLLYVLTHSIRLSVILAILLSVLVYGAALLLTKAIRKEDILSLKKGAKIIAVLEKTGIRFSSEKQKKED